MANFFDYLESLSIDAKIWMFLWVAILLLPFIALAIWLKKRVKVGQVDTYTFTVYYGLGLFMLYSVLENYLGSEFALKLFVDYAGAWLGVVIFFIVFNHISEGVHKTYIIQMEIERFNLNINSCYTYSYKGRTCVIKYSEEKTEAFVDFFRRLLGKRIYLIIEDARFQFTEHYVNDCILCTTWQEGYVPINENGKLIKRHCIVVTPIPTTKYNQTEFLIHFDNYKRINEDFARLFNENMKIRRNIYVVGRKLATGFAERLEQALFGNLTVQEVLKQLETLSLDTEQPDAPEEYEGEEEIALEGVEESVMESD